MNDSKMADNVFAAFLSCFFSWVFFFFFGWDFETTAALARWDFEFPASCFGTILAFRGIRTSGICDGRRPDAVVGGPTGKPGQSDPVLVALSTLPARRGGTPAFPLEGRGPSFSIILMEGWSATPLPSHVAESGGRRINIVYTWKMNRVVSASLPKPL